MVKAFADPVETIRQSSPKGEHAWMEDNSGAQLHKNGKEKEIYCCLIEEYDLFAVRHKHIFITWVSLRTPMLFRKKVIFLLFTQSIVMELFGKTLIFFKNRANYYRETFLNQRCKALYHNLCFYKVMRLSFTQVSLNQRFWFI